MNAILTFLNQLVDLLDARAGELFVFRGCPSDEATIKNCENRRLKKTFIGPVKWDVEEDRIVIRHRLRLPVLHRFEATPFRVLLALMFLPTAPDEVLGL